MPQYIVFRATEETRRLALQDLQKYYEAGIVGYFVGEKGKKKQSIRDVAALLGVAEQDITLVPVVTTGTDKQTAIALKKGDIVKIYGIDAQDALDVFPSPPETFTDHKFLL